MIEVSVLLIHPFLVSKESIALAS
jgi:hypothetical protein